MHTAGDSCVTILNGTISLTVPGGNSHSGFAAAEEEKQNVLLTLAFVLRRRPQYG